MEGGISEVDVSGSEFTGLILHVWIIWNKLGLRFYGYFNVKKLVGIII
jgi:hypothetical protein